VTPQYYHRGTNMQFMVDYAYSAYLSSRFFKICGLGALKCESKNECHPFSLTEAAKYAFLLEDAVDEDDELIPDVYNLVLKEFTDDQEFRSWVCGPGNPLGEVVIDEPTISQFLKSIPGGVMSHFFRTVKSSNAFQDHCVDENGDYHVGIDFSPESIRSSFAFGSYGTGLSHPIDRQEWSMFKYHPLVNLLRFIAWNPKGCCPPMHEFTTSEEFFNIYQPQVSIL
jgi:hypothetical protein